MIKTKTIIFAGIISLVIIGIAIFTVAGFIERKNNADEYIKPFTAYVYEYNNHTYIPKSEIRLSKESLKSLMKVYEYDMAYEHNGDLKINISVGNNQRWLVYMDNPNYIKWIQRIKP